MQSLVLWGGPTDFCIAIDFEIGSHDLEEDLESNGHPVMECVHNCAHGTPPLEPSVEQPDRPLYGMVWEFMLAHPYWLEDGYSPYQEFGELPEAFPEWCAMGAGNASPRVGECGPSEC